jgi:hypothetical protein
MATDISGVLYRRPIDAPINFLEIPTITVRYAQDGDGDDDRSASIAWSPLDEYRGAGSLSLRRIRTLGADKDPTFAAERARSILIEARAAIERILGERGSVLTTALTELIQRI